MPRPIVAIKARLPLPTSNLVPRQCLLMALDTCLISNVQVMLVFARAGAGTTILLAQRQVGFTKG